jgi:hypothetical protein
MRLLRLILTKIAAVLATRPLSRFVCEGCDSREDAAFPLGDGNCVGKRARFAPASWNLHVLAQRQP